MRGFISQSAKWVESISSKCLYLSLCQVGWQYVSVSHSFFLPWYIIHTRTWGMDKQKNPVSIRKEKTSKLREMSIHLFFNFKPHRNLTYVNRVCQVHAWSFTALPSVTKILDFLVLQTKLRAVKYLLNKSGK